MKGSMKRLAILIACVTLVSASLAHGKIYKYKDENGNVVYSSTPPKNGKAHEIKPRVQKVDPAEARKRLDALGEKANNRGKNREVVQQSKAQEEAIAKREAENCKQARKNLEILQTSPRVQTADAQGNMFYLDEESKTAKEAEAKGQIEQFCK